MRKDEGKKLSQNTYRMQLMAWPLNLGDFNTLFGALYILYKREKLEELSEFKKETKPKHLKVQSKSLCLQMALLQVGIRYKPQS